MIKQTQQFARNKIMRPFSPFMRSPRHEGDCPLEDHFTRNSVSDVQFYQSTLGRIGSLEVRLARTASEIRKAQRLRYHVFYKEMSAEAVPLTNLTRRDTDPFDRFCDHLLVIDHDTPSRSFRRSKPQIVGTYRLMRQDIASLYGGFYSESEYAVDVLVDRKPNMRFLELGRSCVLQSYRNKRTVELLWRGIWAYVQYHDIDVMFGCASLEGTDPDHLAVPLSFLHHHARAPEEWLVHAVADRYVSMNRMSEDIIDKRTALRALPPLIKGYLRLGGYVGDGAVIDHQFGTTDVLIVLPVSAIEGRYLNYYGTTSNDHG